MLALPSGGAPTVVVRDADSGAFTPVPGLPPVPTPTHSPCPPEATQILLLTNDQATLTRGNAMAGSACTPWPPASNSGSQPGRTARIGWPQSPQTGRRSPPLTTGSAARPVGDHQPHRRGQRLTATADLAGTGDRTRPESQRPTACLPGRRAGHPVPSRRRTQHQAATPRHLLTDRHRPNRQRPHPSRFVKRRTTSTLPRCRHWHSAVPPRVESEVDAPSTAQAPRRWSGYTGSWPGRPPPPAKRHRTPPRPGPQTSRVTRPSTGSDRYAPSDPDKCAIRKGPPT